MALVKPKIIFFARQTRNSSILNAKKAKDKLVMGL
jgi:hypothetical protein